MNESHNMGGKESGGKGGRLEALAYTHDPHHINSSHWHHHTYLGIVESSFQIHTHDFW
jgi:hypothetical protein